MSNSTKYILALYLCCVANFVSSERFARIVGGQLSSIDNYPYMAYIHKSTNGLYCGGSIVSPTCVLTAAHCIEDITANKIIVRTGITRSAEQGGESAVAFYRIPTDYNQPKHNMDVAVLKLTKPLRGKNVKTIPLELHKEVRANEMVSISGWGKIDILGKTDSAGLRTVNVTVIPWNFCFSAYKYLRHEFVNENMFCAHDEEKDACGGDSGGPVVYKGQQVGVVSWGLLCGLFPGVYTKFSSPAVSRFIQTTYDEICREKV